MGRLIIAVGREYGSGGREIGEKLAKRLGISFYDKELLTLVAKESGYCEEILQKNDEQPTNSFLYSLVMDTYASNGYSASNHFTELPLNHKVFLAQFDVIRNLAQRESCVIVGRCADYALAGNPDCFSVFIHAKDMNFRIERVRKDNPDRVFKDDNKVIDFINKTDRKRANYYNYYSNKKWADSRSYDMSVDSSVLGIDKSVDFILDYAKMRYGIEV